MIKKATQVVKLSDVIKFYIDNCQLPPGEVLVSSETWVDISKSEIVMQLTIDHTPEQDEKE